MTSCTICLEKCIVPCMVIHESDHAVCRYFYCEECICKLSLCPTCRGPMKNYMVCAWKINFEANVDCLKCNWNGTALNYYCTHSQEH